MSIKVAINGFGRIGRCALRAAFNDDAFDFVAINDLTDSKTLGHLFKYDSVHGRFNGALEVGESSLILDGKTIPIFAEPNPAKLPWKELGVDIVLECTGRFRTGEKAKLHMDAGAKYVLLSAPGKDIDLTVVMGVNHEQFDADKHFVLSNASCTTNCLAPLAKVLNDKFGLKHALMTTIHAMTNGQNILDLPHSDLRRARAASVSMIPTTTGAAKAVTLVLPELEGRLDGMAIRVPTPNVSIVDLVATFEKEITAEEINAAVKEAAEGSMKGILAYTEEPLVSIDLNGNGHSSIFDASLTKSMGKNMAKVLSWYDNEWGYSMRMLDLAKLVGSKMN